MKLTILLLSPTLFASNSWPSVPIKVKNNTINFNTTDQTCGQISNWLAIASKTNKTSLNNNKKININWVNIPIKKAWQQLDEICQTNYFKEYNNPTNITLNADFLNQLQKSSKISTAHHKISLLGNSIEHKNLAAALTPNTTEMLNINIKWLIIDKYAEFKLGLNNKSLEIKQDNVQPSAKLWQLITKIRSWTNIFDAIIQDLMKTEHIISIADTSITTIPKHNSKFYSNIIIPYVVKTSRTSYSAMQNLPIEINVNYSNNTNNSIRLKVQTKMQDSWNQDENEWPKAIHAIDTIVNLKTNHSYIIAKRKILENTNVATKHKWLGFLRNQKQASEKIKNLYVIISTTKQNS